MFINLPNNRKRLPSRARNSAQRKDNRPNASKLLTVCLLIVLVLLVGLLVLASNVRNIPMVGGHFPTPSSSNLKLEEKERTPYVASNAEVSSETNREATEKKKNNPQKELKNNGKQRDQKNIEKAENRRNIEYDYDEIRKSNGDHESYQDQYVSDFSSFDSYTSPDVLRYGCNLTTVLVEPRLPTADFKYPGWFTLESVATYVSYSCVVIQTSSCSVLPPKAGKKSPPMSKQIEEVTKEIYKRALPMFRGMMERGLVRISILDHEKYQLTSCTNFYTPSNAWMSVNYWKDEFIDNVDNEMILIVQTDGVICRDFDVNLWKDLAFVGAPWAPNRWYGGVVCDELREKFESWTSVKKKQKKVLATDNETPAPDEPLDLKLKNLCANGYGAGFNGGIVLRNSTWMLRAIEACPSKAYSGISTVGKKCVVDDEAEEDEYFALVLSSLGAPLPTAYEAALFGVETFFAEQAREYYGPYNQSQIEAFLTKRWGKDGIAIEEKMHLRKTYGYTYFGNDNNLASSTMRTVPLTFHCPWKYHALDITAGPQVQQECKFLSKIFDESESNYQWK